MQACVRLQCVATLGTTSTCAFDKLQEIGPICELSSSILHKQILIRKLQCISITKNITVHYTDTDIAYTSFAIEALFVQVSRTMCGCISMRRTLDPRSFAQNSDLF